MSKQELANFIRSECIYLPKNNQYMFGKLPGTRYKSQYYLANLTTHPYYMNIVCEEFCELFKELLDCGFKFGLAAPEWSGLPILGALQTYLRNKHSVQVPGLIIRNERKTYGRHNIIEGIPNLDYAYIIINDLGNSTGQFRHCANVLKAHDIKTTAYVFAILNKYSENVSKKWKNDRYLTSHEIHSILNRKDIFGE